MALGTRIIPHLGMVGQRTSATNSSISSGSNNVTWTRPDNIREGDTMLLLISLVINTNPTLSDVPSGWTFVARQDANKVGSVGPHIFLYYKIATASEPSSYSLTANTPGASLAINCLRVVYAPSASPIEGSNGTSSGATDVTSLVIPSVTAANAPTLLLSHLGSEIGPSAPSSMLRIWSATRHAFAIESVNSGATGTRTWTQSSASEMAGINALVTGTAGHRYPIWHDVDAKVTSGTGSSFSITKPSNLAEGDLLILTVRASGNATITQPSGFTLIKREQLTASFVGPTVAAYYKIATASEPTSYSGSFNASFTYSASISRVTNFDSDSPIGPTNSTSVQSATSISIPSVTVTSEFALLVGALGGEATTGKVSTTNNDWLYRSSGQVVDVETPTTMAFMVGSQDVETGATGTKSFTWTSSRQVAGVLFAINGIPTPVATDFPSALLQIGFDNNPGDPVDTITWTDVSTRMRSGEFFRGRQHELQAFEAGTASFVLDDRDRALDPSNRTVYNQPCVNYNDGNIAYSQPSGTYSGKVRPGRPLRLSAIFQGSTTHIFTGIVESWATNYNNNFDQVMTVSAADRFKLLNLFVPNEKTTPYALEVLADNPSLYWRLGD